MRHIFGYTWVYLAHETQLPTANSFRTAYLGLRPLILTRDKHGELHALLNRCRHRAATVCREESGTAKSFQCPYHGWTYQNTGELIGVPWPDAYGTDFRRKDWSLAQVPRIETYRGFVFGTLNESAPPLTDHLGEVRRLLDYWIDRAPGGDVRVESGAHRMVYRGNWKLAYDNAADGYHPAFSHRSLLQMAQRLGESRDMTYFGQSPDQGPMYVQYLGNGHNFIDQRPSYDGAGSFWANQRPQPGREGFEERIRERYGDQADTYLDLCVGAQINLNIFPNLLLIGNQIQVIEPFAVDRTQLTWYATTVGGVPDEVNAMRMRTQEDFPAFGEPDDQANFEECQRGLAVPEVEWVLMNRGYGVEGRQKVSEDGVVTGPVTDELHMRGYFEEWVRLMSRAGAEDDT
ncbi:MAG: Rieske 2Fe-2S domain-containing protein [Streptosporangiales bacterium]|nr:Rieske 2Fe-2S domain-containing protein [Streptosporangiales bacterium]